MFSKSDEDHSTSDHTKLKGERAARTLVTPTHETRHTLRRLVATHDTTRDGAGGGAEAAI